MAAVKAESVPAPKTAPTLGTATTSAAATANNTENAVPSITLSITKDDIKRVLEASTAMAEKLAKIEERENSRVLSNPKSMEIDECKGEEKKESSDDQTSDSAATPAAHENSGSSEGSAGEGSGKEPTSSAKRPLHEMIFEAAQSCEHPMLQSFLEKMKASGSTPREIRAGILVFHDLDMPDKIKLIFDVLGSPVEEHSDTRFLSKEGAQALFRSVIVAISSCIHQDKQVQIEIEKTPRAEEPPAKKRKIVSSPGSVKSAKTQDDSVPGLQSPSRSFDSSLCTLKDEDDFTCSTVRKEFEEIATYATERLIRYYNKNSGEKKDIVAIGFKEFELWRNSEGGKIAPWLELLNLAKWKTPARPAAANPQTPAQPKESEAAEKAPEAAAPSAPATESPKVVKGTEEIKIENEPDDSKERGESSVGEEAKDESKKEGETAQKESENPTKETPKKASPSASAASPMYEETAVSRTVVSFDFTGTTSANEEESVFCINITEGNLSTLKKLVQGTGLSTRACTETSKILLDASKLKEERQVLPIERFHTCLHLLLGPGAQKLPKPEKDLFSSCFADFFSCFDSRKPPLEAGEVDSAELVVGFCFLCAGNKSTKLATGFAMLESEKGIGLTTEQLVAFLRSYLTMLCGLSLMTSAPEGVMKPKLNSARRKSIQQAVENGSKWTLNHFLKTTGNSRESLHTFEAFAGWYTEGGFNVAPWLELLDLKKLLSFVGEANVVGPKTPPTNEGLSPFPGSKSDSLDFLSPRRSGSHSSPLEDSFAQTPSADSPEVLFTFPLANQQSLVVLKEDATYVQKVVEQLGLLSMSPDEVWTSFHAIALEHPPVTPHRGAKASKSTSGKSMPMNSATFVECMQELIQSRSSSSRKRSSGGLSKSASGARDVLINFFHSFDLLQVDRVSLNELMGGLTLLCGGKKSTKLAFAFGVFDQRTAPKSKRGKKSTPNSLEGADLFLFLRSFLIVMFSCCRQSLDLSDDAVNRYIADTANMVTDDVMRYQWRSRQKKRVDFDEFGQWYNEGGFETAPWLELLDLKKWVLVDSLPSFDLLGVSPGVSSTLTRDDSDIPPPPPDDSMDPSFFDDDAGGIMPMDSIDEMDILLMQPSQDKENDAELNKLAQSLSYSPGSSRKPRQAPKTSNSLKFHLVTEDDNGGYVVSVSQKRIHHLRHLLTESGLYGLDGEAACKRILGKAFRDEKSGRYVMTKEDFDSAMREIISSRHLSIESQRALSAVLSEIFTAFDYGGTGRVNATEVACGFTVFCKGKKSDKLEYAFEVLDRERRGKLSQSDTAKYLRSFLTVLLNVVSTTSLDSDAQEDTMVTTSGMRCERTISTVARAVEAGSSWAASQAFRNRRGSRQTICFDEFAEWYTHVGYSNIPWLELLDLRKWVIGES